MPHPAYVSLLQVTPNGDSRDTKRRSKDHLALPGLGLIFVTFLLFALARAQIRTVYVIPSTHWDRMETSRSWELKGMARRTRHLRTKLRFPAVRL